MTAAAASAAEEQSAGEGNRSEECSLLMPIFEGLTIKNCVLKTFSPNSILVLPMGPTGIIAGKEMSGS